MDKCYGVAPSTSIRHKPPENLWLLAGLRRVPLDRDVPGCRTKHEDRAASVDLEARRRDLTDYDPGIGPGLRAGGKTSRATGCATVPLGFHRVTSSWELPQASSNSLAGTPQALLAGPGQ